MSFIEPGLCTQNNTCEQICEEIENRERCDCFHGYKLGNESHCQGNCYKINNTNKFHKVFIHITYYIWRESSFKKLGLMFNRKGIGLICKIYSHF